MHRAGSSHFAAYDHPTWLRQSGQVEGGASQTMPAHSKRSPYPRLLAHVPHLALGIHVSLGGKQPLNNLRMALPRRFPEGGTSTLQVWGHCSA